MPSTILDIGYYHITADEASLSREPPIAYRPDTAQLMQLKRGETLSETTLRALHEQGEVALFSDASRPPVSYALFRKNASDEPSYLQDGAIEKITPLHFAPKETERMTLELGLQRYGKEAAQVMIMADDLGLPSGLNNHLSLLVPESYRTVLETHGFNEPLLVSERIARNRAVSAIKRQRPQPEDAFQVMTPAQMREAECHDGTCSITSTYLVSDSIKRNSLGLKGCGGVSSAVALSKPGTENANDEVPACGVIVAGQIKHAIDKGYDKMIMVHHRKDDVNMPRKVMDGNAIGAWLWPESDMVCRSVQIMSSPETVQKVNGEAMSRLPFTSTKAFSFKDFNDYSDPRLYDEVYSKRA